MIHRILSLLLILACTGIHGTPAPAASDDSLTWTWHNPLPQGNDLNALAVGNDFIIAAGYQGTVLRSVDGGNWTPVDTGTRRPIFSAASGDGRVMLGGAGVLVSSEDGITWTTVLDEEERLEWNSGLAYGDGVWIAVYVSYDAAEGQSDGVIYRSTNGTDWDRIVPDALKDLPFGSILSNVAYGGDGRFLVGGRSDGVGRIVVSTDAGETWEDVGDAPETPLNSVFWDGEIFAGAGGEGTVAFSQDGFDWEEKDTGSDLHLSDIVAASGEWIATHRDGNSFLVSEDGDEWSMVDTQPGPGLNAITRFQGQLVAAGAAGSLLSGPSPSEMEGNESVTTLPLADVAHNGTIYVAVGGGYRWPLDQFGFIDPNERVLMSSADLEEWTVHDTGDAGSLYGVAYGDGRFVAVGEGGTVLTSSNGLDWTQRQSGTDQRLNAIAYGDGFFVAVGNEGFVGVSSDGIEWVSPGVPVDPHSGSEAGDLHDIAYGNGRFVAVGSYGPFGSAYGNENHFIHASNPFSWEFTWIPHPPMDAGPHDFNGSLAGITHGPDGFLAFGVSYMSSIYDLPLVLHSKEGEQWTYVETATEFAPWAVSSSPNGYVAIGHKLAPRGVATAYFSHDGLDWEEAASYGAPPPEILWNLYHRENHLVGVGENGALVSSISSHPFISRHPRPIQAFEGETIELSVEAIDPLGGELEYQWFYEGMAVEDGSRISGSQTDRLGIEEVSTADAGTYAVEVSNDAGTSVSMGALVTIGEVVRVNNAFDHDTPGWQESRFNSIQEAVEAASTDDVSMILVEPGIYYETIEMMGKPVVLVSEYPLDPAIVSTTVLDASKSGENGESSGPIIRIADGEGNRTQIRGLTLRNATGGAGIHIQESAPIIEHNRIEGNSGQDGGGIYARTHGGANEDTLQIRYNRIRENTAGRGGGVFILQNDSDTLISGNSIEGNEAGEGGGVFAEVIGSSGTLMIEDNRVKGNVAAIGGGVALWGGTPRETNFTGNLILSNRSSEQGAALFVGESHHRFRIEHSVIDGNSSPDYPVLGGHSASFPEGSFSNNIVSQNRILQDSFSGSSNHLGGLMLTQGLDIWFNNFWENRANRVEDQPIPYGQDGNLAFDPLFADPESGDFRLRSQVGRWDPEAEEWVTDDEHSPLIAAGEPDLHGVRPNIGAYGLSETASKPLEDPIVSIGVSSPGFLNKMSESPVYVILGRTGSLDDALPFIVSVSGDAEEGVDYSAGTIPVEFATGEAATAVELTPLAPETLRGDRGVTFSLEESSDFGEGSPSWIDVEVRDHPYHAWVAEHFSEEEWNDPDRVGPMAASPDGSMTNLERAAFGVSPDGTGTNHLPRALPLSVSDEDSPESGYTGPRIRFIRPVPHDAFEYSLAFTSDLNGWWEEATTFEYNVEEIEPAPDGSSETVTLILDDSDGWLWNQWISSEKLFFRVNVRMATPSAFQ